ncbi:MAG TPA: SUMF1/EgtB/PvdO family nonheme iron enzyme [Planctomycetota bacterium]|nr:SUMF1/EgtB/PvdO family nonheme iron enzyme [Planctomycetota bacterium]
MSPQPGQKPVPTAPDRAIDAHACRAGLTQLLRAARARTDAIFELLEPRAFVARPIPERHRLVFYLGHLEVFDWNLLVRDCLGRPSRHAEWEQRFAFGIDPVDGELPQDRPEQWPDVDTVRRYGMQLRADVDAELARAPLDGWLERGWAWRLAIEHRAMHAETLAYLLASLPHEAKRPGPAPGGLDAAPPRAELVPIPAGHATLGRSAAERHAGWDNEYEMHRVFVPPFAIDRHAVTNAQWLEFVEAGGYRDERLWTPADWAWRCAQRIERPGYWQGGPGAWRWRAMFASVPLPPAWPVYVSHAEASAYARWRGRRLPSEAQWHRAALGGPDGRERAHPWGDAEPVPGTHGNFGFAAWDPQPVDAHPAGQSAFGVHGLCGNGWQWTRTVFAPFAGFEPLPFYRGYSADFFDGQHFVAKGASAATETMFLRRSFRNWFQPRYPYVFATFRCVDESG